MPIDKTHKFKVVGLFTSWRVIYWFGRPWKGICLKQQDCGCFRKNANSVENLTNKAKNSKCELLFLQPFCLSPAVFVALLAYQKFTFVLSLIDVVPSIYAFRSALVRLWKRQLCDYYISRTPLNFDDTAMWSGWKKVHISSPNEAPFWKNNNLYADDTKRVFPFSPTCCHQVFFDVAVNGFFHSFSLHLWHFTECRETFPKTSLFQSNDFRATEQPSCCFRCFLLL